MPSPKYHVNSDSFLPLSFPFSRSHKSSSTKLYKPNRKTGIYYQQLSSNKKVDQKQWIIRILFFLLFSYFVISYIKSSSNSKYAESIPELSIAQQYQPISSQSTNNRIPKIVHFIYGLKGPNPTLDLIHYLSIKSAHDRLQPDTIMFHYHYLPTGELFEKAKIYLTLNKVDLVPKVFDQPVTHFAHQADIIRLNTLNKYGGIYLDLDVISLRSLDNLLDNDFVMGHEGIGGAIGLCNAVILSKPGSKFLQRWIQTYRTFNQSDWNYHSVVLPGKLATHFKDEIHIMNYTSFFWPLWDGNGLRTLFLEKSYQFDQGNYLTHIWESAANPHLMKELSTDVIKHVDNSLYCQLRFFLKSDDEEPIQPCKYMEHSERKDKLIGHWPLKNHLDIKINPTPAIDDSGNDMHGILRNGYYFSIEENRNNDGAYVNGKDSYIFLSMPSKMSLEKNGLTVHWLMKTNSEKQDGTALMVHADTYQLHIRTKKITSSSVGNKAMLSLGIDTYVLEDGWKWMYQPNLSISSSLIPINNNDQYAQYTLVIQKNKNKDDNNENRSVLEPNLALYKDGYVMASHSRWQPILNHSSLQQKNVKGSDEKEEKKSIIRGIWFGSAEPSKYQVEWDSRPSLDAWYKDISVWEKALDLSFIRNQVLVRDLKDKMESVDHKVLFNTDFNNAPNQNLENDLSNVDNDYTSKDNKSNSDNNIVIIDNELEG